MHALGFGGRCSICKKSGGSHLRVVQCSLVVDDLNVRAPCVCWCISLPPSLASSAAAAGKPLHFGSYNDKIVIVILVLIILSLNCGQDPPLGILLVDLLYKSTSRSDSQGLPWINFHT